MTRSNPSYILPPHLISGVQCQQIKVKKNDDAELSKAVEAGCQVLMQRTADSGFPVLFDSMYLCIAHYFVRLVCWLLYGHSLSVTRASPLLKGSYAVVNPPIKYITRDHQSHTRADDDDEQWSGRL